MLRLVSVASMVALSVATFGACGSGDDDSLFEAEGSGDGGGAPADGGSGGALDASAGATGGGGASGGSMGADAGSGGRGAPIGSDASVDATASDAPAPIPLDAAPLDGGFIPLDADVGAAGVIRCGTTGQCPITGFPPNQCCWVPPTVILPFPTQCVPLCPTGVVINCDDRTDCPGGQVCCGRLAEFGGAGCVDACFGQDNVQLCRSSGECEIGSTCQPVPTAPGFEACL